MRTLIFNELEYAKQLEQNITTDFLGMANLRYLIKYYNTLELNKEQIKNKILELFPKTQLIKIDTVLKSIKNEKCSEPKLIKIYREELDFIKKEPSLAYQKIMFIMLCLAKYRENNGFLYISNFTSISYPRIFAYADLKYNEKNKEAKNKMLAYFGNSNMKYVEMFTNTATKINYYKDNGEIVLEFIIDDNMILHYEKYIGMNIGNCINCGKLIKKNNNKQKYCKECANIIREEQKHIIYINTIENN